ncbi:MAU2 chromatid cohesion factor [Podospora fimiseda]|uniref:MAU2 chromatid cohesion factor n=1 Tax=Podospora fimiseda TaxID=252190 RepID=A0AAN7BRJ5_9PEZI|nr:MAU2 chromatid cohesion factor [Podospora fimiseda]
MPPPLGPPVYNHQGQHSRQQRQQPMHHLQHQYQQQQQNQYPQQQQQHYVQNQQFQPPPHLQQAQQLPPPVSPQHGYPQYANGYTNGNQQHYQFNQYVHPQFVQHHSPQLHQQHLGQQQQQQPPPLSPQQSQPQGPSHFYPNSPSSMPVPQPQYVKYNGAPTYSQPSPAPAPAPLPSPVSAPAPAPVPTLAPAPVPAPAPANAPAPLPQFVNPSFLQQQPQPVLTPKPPTPASHALQNPPPPPPPIAMSPRVPVARPPQAVKPEKTKSPKLHQIPAAPRGTPINKINTKENRRPSSGHAVARSPVTPGGSSHTETLPLLLSVAEECLEKAGAAARVAAKSMSPGDIEEHHKLVATALGCMDVALKSNKLYPKLEVRLCLRYASVLMEETNNIMDAETTLTRSISISDKHCFTDLKYCGYFLLMKTLYQRTPKGAITCIDTYINACGGFKYVPWIYAFRFLKASFYFGLGIAAEQHSIDNLRRIAGVANQRKDHTILVMAVLLEGFAHLRSMKEDWVTRVQICIAQVSKQQLENSAHTPQTDVLHLLLDLACSLHQKSYQISAQKLTALLQKLEELNDSPDWGDETGEMLLPINRLPNTVQTVSKDTTAVLRLGDDKIDYLVLSTLGKHEAWALAWVFNGIIAHYQSMVSTTARSSSMWTEAVKILEKISPLPKALPEAVKCADWARELLCYSYILIGLEAASLSDWAKVRQCLDSINAAQPPTTSLETLTLYLEGVFLQGSAKLEKALGIWKDEKFAVDPSGALKNGNQLETELSILAALNRVWIFQDTSCRDDAETAELIDLLRPICEDNPDVEIRTAYNLVMAASTFHPPLSLPQLKRAIQGSMHGAQAMNNTQYLSMSLNIMRNKLFENVVGEQALKSAKAGAMQARKSGNLLWMSVADGMLAQSHEMQGQINEARMARMNGVRLANEAYDRTHV